MIGPTDRQAEVLAFMRAYATEFGAPPTMREISAHFGWSSTNAAAEHVKLLTKKGLVRHYPGRSRGWVPTEPT